MWLKGEWLRQVTLTTGVCPQPFFPAPYSRMSLLLYMMRSFPFTPTLLHQTQISPFKTYTPQAQNLKFPDLPFFVPSHNGFSLCSLTIYLHYYTPCTESLRSYDFVLRLYLSTKTTWKSNLLTHKSNNLFSVGALLDLYMAFDTVRRSCSVIPFSFCFS